MDIFQIIIIPAAAAVDTLVIGVAAGFCSCYKLKKKKILFTSAFITIIHGIFFMAGLWFESLIETFMDKSLNSLYPFLLIFIGARFLYKGVFCENQKIGAVPVSILLIFVSAIDSLAAGFVIEYPYKFISLLFCTVFCFFFTLSGYYGSKKFLKKGLKSISPEFACGGIIFSVGIVSLIV